MDYQVRMLLDTLISSGKVNQSELEKIKLEALSSGVDVLSLLVKKDVLKEVDILEAKAKMLGIPLFLETRLTVSPELLSLIGVDLAKKYSVIPFGVDKAEKKLTLICLTPEDQSMVDFFTKRTGYRVATL